MKVFVYGTLKRGFHNHSVMESAEGVYLGVGIRSCAQIYDTGGFPALVETNDPDDVVVGEIYQVSDHRPLDMLEGYNPSTDDGMYLRRVREIVNESGDPELVELYVWNYGINQMPLIESGVYV
jgi:gamma-glutamylaminecyclotransferase